jgi:ubiquitin carboxyl-terminal hydrolase L3
MNLFQAPNTPLSSLITSAIPLPPSERARLIESSSTIAEAHAVAAEQGATAAPLASADVDLHFVAFVKTAQNQLWELDGRRKGPLNRGQLNPADDVLSEKALELGVKRFLKGAGEDLRFSLLALAPTLD